MLTNADDPPLILYTDGASRKNPGPAAIAYAIYDNSGELVEKGAKCIGVHTNNEAEYEAILWGLHKVTERRCTSVRAYLDSELVVRQFTGQYAAKKPTMARYAERLAKYKEIFEDIELISVPRDNPRTQLVDSLVNEALDGECGR